ncbi:hypothetical protein CFC21_090250 [Triticum aestivum]|uniref:Uncharacterized protein n=2 Tax=Triticum aestivum TaxID=4565 RepID=A0A3B6PV61_WHEAT|nr:hypothetical protein CFC21_090250 [Triticum aestivum]
MSTEDCVHEMGLLSDEKAKQLFMAVVRKETQKESLPRDWEICSNLRKLWEMCGGLLLTIVTMAGQVACNPDKSDEEWIEVYTALAPRPSTSRTEYQLTKILSNCYNDMPVEIKTCALYFSIFPRGQKISRKRLTRRWISEGLAIEHQGLSAEEVAETYLNHLMRRKLLRATEHSSNGKVKSYQVHGVVLEYLVYKASEENFVTIVGGWVMPPPTSKIRRISIQCSGLRCGKELEAMNLSHVRDLTMFGSLEQLPSSSFKFGVVQILDLEGCKDFKRCHTKEIYRMLLLKYLSLRGTDIKKLTKRIGDLRYLETLDIRETDVLELPKAICKLERVVNIFGGNKRTRKALKLPEELGKMGNMKALRALSGIDIGGEETTADFHHLTDLRKLTIYNINYNMIFQHSVVFSSSIEYLGGFSLRALVIHDDSAEFLKSLGGLSSPPMFLNALELSGKLIELPKWIAAMDALTKLTLSLTALRADNLELLSKICSLFSLTLSLNAAKQDEETAAIIEDNKACSDGVIPFPVGGFENLKLLRFIAPYVPQLSFPDGAVPTLERLELRFSNFEGLVGIRGLKNLQQVYIKVQDEASETTELIVKEMATAAREDRQGPRIIFD